jgi:23S rRNA (uracil1939-C5)-methyltransferase
MPPRSEGAHTRGPCAISDECGGCALIDDPYENQLRLKRERVLTAMRAHSELAGIEVAHCLAAPERLDYRNRAKLAVFAGDGVPRIGLYQRGTNRIVDLAECVVTKPALRRAVGAVRHWLENHRLARPDGPVMVVDLRAGLRGRWHLTLVLDDVHIDPRTLPLESLIAANPDIEGIAVNFGDPSSSYPMGETTAVVAGAETFDALVPTDDGETGVAVAVPVGGFFQVATALLPAIHSRMRSHLESDGPLCDAYCGVGVHGLMIERGRSGPGAFVLGVEESEAATSAARTNARRLGIDARYVRGRVEDILAAELEARPMRRFVLNPARAGCRKAALDTLLRVERASIAYLSCNPDTLARDLAILVRGGLEVREVLPLDLMPQTDQVEVLALIA